MCFICRFNVYFSRNQRKCWQNGEDENLKSMRQMIYHLVGLEILNITVHFVFILTYISRVNGENVRKISKNGYVKIKFTSQTIYHLVGHEILNKTLYFFKRYYSQILRYLRKCMKKFNIIE